PHDMGTKLGSFFAKLSEADLCFFHRVDKRVISCAPGFHDLAVEMKDLFASGAFMEVIYVLRNNVNVKILLKVGDEFVSGVWFCFHHLLPSLVVEFEHEGSIIRPRVEGGHIFNAVLLP
ncbi:MAG: hypothetical protein K0S12_2013, partial [Bacteroidetes bacterium]|nr:hypothetical protein [Bacteroidota bacterium]